jgi:hypothetical protein
MIQCGSAFQKLEGIDARARMNASIASDIEKVSPRNRSVDRTASSLFLLSRSEEILTATGTC